MYPFDRFSESAKGALTLAQQEAERGGQSYIGTEHLLLGLMGQEDGLAGTALASFGLQLPAIRATIEKVLESNPPPIAAQIIPTSQVKRIIEMAFDLARRENSSIVDTGHLLVAIVEEGDGIASHVLRDNAVTVDRVKAEVAGLRQAGQGDSIQAQARPPAYKHRHLDVTDQGGRTVVVDVIFPSDYSDQQCSDVTASIRSAIETRQS